ncbi:MAG: glycosyltransferase [Lachnospiraceae bacterium]|nr:glycosyltransferase [Lachnospiraceae bacterium]
MAGKALLKRSNLKKAYYYCKKNGILPAFYAALERIQNNNTCYEKRTPTQEELEAQRSAVWEKPECFSILVPAYETDGAHLHEMIDSVLAQTYPQFELIVADASVSDKVETEMQYYKDSRIRYIRLPENKGISGNTNAALSAACGSYIALLDHDDILEADALYRMMEAIAAYRERTGEMPQMLYSDEDKCSGDLSVYYEPHRKEKFNLDLIMSNNYICHFLVMKAELMHALGFRAEYDGAQDHDLVLRAAARLMHHTNGILHVPYVLYHWRCHTGSTAENPQSKMYAYEAGRRAVEDFCRTQGWRARVVHTRHLGFFRVEYEGDVLAQRTDLAAVGGRIVRRGRIDGGAYAQDGRALYEGLNAHFSGYMHRAVLQQDAFAVDIRRIRVREELRPLLARIQKEEKDIRRASLKFGREAARLGYRILWDPFMENRD